MEKKVLMVAGRDEGYRKTARGREKKRLRSRQGKLENDRNKGGRRRGRER